MGHSGEIIHYAATQVADGIVINMQTMYMTWLSMAIVFVLFMLAVKNVKMVPSGIQNVMEFFIDFLRNLMKDQLGEDGAKKMAPFVITLFMFIFIANELGLSPQVFMPIHFEWTSPTNDINTCFALSITVALGVYVVGVARKGIGHFKHFISPSPAFLPLHLLDEVTKPLTMALRLFGNILAGEILLGVLYQLSPWIIPEFWVMFSLFIGFLQAFIFTMLTLTSYATVFAHH
ncbi:MAG: F0F1 ATP synthase subunit A [Phascolarctobacterium sp.]|nr:F0F1 ATP synthase subunit A [Candidatus Phascolarctobacterium equi]